MRCFAITRASFTYLGLQGTTGIFRKKVGKSGSPWQARRGCSRVLVACSNAQNEPRATMDSNAPPGRTGGNLRNTKTKSQSSTLNTALGDTHGHDTRQQHETSQSRILPQQHCSQRHPKSRSNPHGYLAISSRVSRTRPWRPLNSANPATREHPTETWPGAPQAWCCQTTLEAPTGLTVLTSHPEREVTPH